MFISADAIAAFVLAAELGSFSAAARRLGKRQSTISETIANLEIDLGITLFERGGRQPQLTAAGQRLLPAARQTLAAQDSLQLEAQLLAGGLEPRLTLVLSDTFHTGDFEAMLSEFAERFPTLELECLVGEQEDVLALLQSGRAQLGLLTALAGYPADIASCSLPRPADTALYVAAGHALARQDTVTAAHLRQHRELRLKTYQDSPV
ncbi:transcriptional regulator, partial [Vogesella sp. EB]|uniref:LysR family transcriptional regulator n=1 Tax=Vogesella sp. EB TaxID=1526735 RepID=UPI00064D3847